MKFDFLPFNPRRKSRSEFGGEYTTPGDTIPMTFGETTEFGEVLKIRRMPCTPARWVASVNVKHGKHAGNYEVIV